MIARGFTLPAVIFLLVILAGLSTYMVTLSTTQHFTSLLAMKGARAYNAAKSGTEWGVYQAVVGGSCVASTPLTLTGGAFDNYSVTVTCSSSTHTESGNTYNVFTITSLATHGTFGDRDFVSRSIRVVATDAP